MPGNDDRPSFKISEHTGQIIPIRYDDDDAGSQIANKSKEDLERKYLYVGLERNKKDVVEEKKPTGFQRPDRSKRRRVDFV